MRNLDRLDSDIQKKYLVSFLILIFFGLTALALQQFYISKQQPHAQTVNLAGRQRMLSQRLIRNALLGLESQEVRKVYKDLKANHEILKNGSDKISKAFNKKIKASYNDLDPILKKIENIVFCKQAECAITQEEKSKLVTYTDDFLYKMDSIVFASSVYVQNELKKLSYIEIGIFLFIVLALLYQAQTTLLPIKNLLLDKIKDYELEKAKNLKLEGAAQMGTWELDINTSKVNWSSQVYKIHAVSEGINLDTVAAIEFFPGEYKEKITQYVERAIINKESYDDELRFIDAKGNHKWVRAIGEPLLDHNQNVIKLIGLFQDITKAKKQEDKIKDSAEIFKVAIEGAKVGIWRWDMVNDSVYFDETWFQLYGLDPQTTPMEANTWKQRVHPADIEKAYKDFVDYMKRKSKSFENIHRVKHLDGHWVYILSRGKFINFKEDGRAQAFIGTCQDITDTIKSQNEQKLILSSLKLGVWKWNIIDDDLQWDDSLYNLYGYERSDFSGAYEAWERTLRDDYKERAVKELNDSLKGLKDFDTTFPIITKSGEEKFIGAKAAIERGPDGSPVYMYGINWDKTSEVSTQVKLEEQRKIAEHNAKLANIGEMAAGVGHEINNPLSIIKGYISILKKSSPGDSETLEKINSATHRIQQIVAGLRQFVRSTDDDEETISLTSLLKTSVEMMSELFAKQGIKIEYVNEHKHNSYNIIGNLGRIQQVVVNLITNAKDAVKDLEDGEIKITSCATDDEVQFTVEDNGTGIPDSVRERIFDPFFTTKEVNKGTGIGLSLVFSIVKEHEGKIEFDTEEGKGTKFTLTFPRSLKRVEHKSTKIAQEKVSHKGLTVMVVDDELDILEILKSMLEDYEINVSIFSNGLEAFNEIKENKSKYDLIITDMQMPKMNGEELIKNIRSMKDLEQPKILISTGGVNIDIEDENNPLNKLANGYLFKPFSQDQLEEALDSISRQ